MARIIISMFLYEVQLNHGKNRKIFTTKPSEAAGIARDLRFTLNSHDESFHVEQTANHTEETQPKAPSPCSYFRQLTKSCNRLIGCITQVL